ncbi:oligosaccharide flippase family protein [Vibrio parahaemolyticus]|nr:oligosaccharide flippase family protein [Vibrio parahaemolyticus]MDG2683799.1 oligosaccharide flippase family protein [Vibrio parahaemolyticus]
MRKALFFIGGTIFAKSITVLTLPYLTRALSTSGYGELSYLNSILAFFVIIINLGGDAGILRFSKYYGKSWEYISFKISVGLGLCTSVFIVIAYWLIGTGSFQVAIILVITSLSQFIVGLIYSIYRANNRNTEYIFAQVMLSTIWLISTVTIVELVSNEPISRIFSLLIASVTVLLLFLYKDSSFLKTVKKTKVNYQHVREFCIFSLPLLLHGIANTIKSNFDKIYLYKTVDTSFLGIYSAANQLASIFLMLILIINQYFVPIVYSGIKEGSINIYKLKKYSIFSFAFVFILPLITFFIPEKYFTYILGEGFEGVKYYSLLFLTSTLMMIPYLILVNHHFYHGDTKRVSVINLLSVLVYILLVLFFSKISVSYIPYASIVSVMVLYFGVYSISVKK